jgi:hypothetical protein
MSNLGADLIKKIGLIVLNVFCKLDRFRAEKQISNIMKQSSLQSGTIVLNSCNEAKLGPVLLKHYGFVIYKIRSKLLCLFKLVCL